VDSINKVSKEYSVKINTRKTKIMCISRQDMVGKECTC